MNEFYAIGFIVGGLSAMYVLPFLDFVMAWLELRKAVMQVKTQIKINELSPRQGVSAIGFAMPSDYDLNDEYGEEDLKTIGFYKA